MEVGRMVVEGLPGRRLLKQSSSRVLARSVGLRFAFSAQASSSTAINLKNRLRFFRNYLSGVFLAKFMR